jgi:hypothetical protein
MFEISKCCNFSMDWDRVIGFSVLVTRYLTINLRPFLGSHMSKIFMVNNAQKGTCRLPPPVKLECRHTASVWRKTQSTKQIKYTRTMYLFYYYILYTVIFQFGKTLGIKSKENKYDVIEKTYYNHVLL